MNGNFTNEISWTSGIVGFFSKLLNIAPSQWSRVSECWLLTFFFKVGSAIGWTVITAAFVSRFGIAALPVLFIVNALFIMAGTFVFEQFIMRMKREVLMIIMVLCAAICLFIASFVYAKSSVGFFILVIFAESVFLAQFNVFIPILVGDRFTPLESQKTFPVVESGETIGGMLGAGIVGIFASKISTPIFMYFWIGLLACVVCVFIIANYVTNKLPPLPFRVQQSEKKGKTLDQVKFVVSNIKKIPFLKGLIIIVLFQWIFMNILDFQYTKSLEQSVTNKREATVALLDRQSESSAKQLLPRQGGASFKASILDVSGILVGAKDETPAPVAKRALTPLEEQTLTQKLGMYKGILYFSALVVQVVVASRLITSLGIVGSMLLHPIIMLLSLVWMFLRFGFASAFVGRLNFEMTDVVHNNAYFTSHYAFPKSIRDQAAEFLEGIVRPLGTVLGMALLLGLQFFIEGKELSMWVHAVLFVIMAIILLVTLRLRSHYTQVSEQQLFSDLPYPDKINAIEILAQRGHENAPFILIRKLNETSVPEKNHESPVIRMKLLSTIGLFRDYQALPEIFDALTDKNADIRLEAAQALMNYNDIGEKFYSQTFSRYRMVETLKDVFKREPSGSVRGAIIKVFSLLRQPDIVPFLLGLLKDADPKVRADCVHTLGMFHDPSTAYYILPSLSDQDQIVKSHAIAALWQFPKYRQFLEKEIIKLVDSENPNDVKAAIFAAGEINLPLKKTLYEFLRGDSEELRLEAAFALTKFGDERGFKVLLGYYLALPDDDFSSLRRFIHKLKRNAKRMVQNIITNEVSATLNFIMSKYRGVPISSIDPVLVRKLHRLYMLLEQHEELFAIESALKNVNI